MFVSNVCLYFQGPPGLQVVWRSGYPNSGFFQDYAAVIDIDEEKPSPISIDSCGALQYRSTLSIMVGELSLVGGGGGGGGGGRERERGIGICNIFLDF